MSEQRVGADVSVAEAARAAGLSHARVGALVRSGRVPSRRIGRQHVITDPEALLAMPRRAGRPMSPRMAWALLLLADDRRPEWVSPGEVYRLRRHLDKLAADPEPEVALQALVRNRAARRPYRAQQPGALLEDDSVVASGLSDARSGMSAGVDVEVYVHEDDVRAVVRRHLLVDAAGGRANVWLHSSELVPAPSLRLQVAADLAEHGGPRERARAREIVREVVGNRR
ncbi:hypothetical protein J1G42_14765 [Cellulomonas sp. zg-ZUI222]|uniref:hypothetical protein n=1 Tax=Cellulomonas wangleii TaxID=2816956 RepID=UPI001A94AEF3|nr:hypothetical protein [Cellulomonas wangleii]MBO0922084.1 hypothetical protein [Cellulomonas wangleii]